MLITHTEYEQMHPEERIVVKGVLEMNGLALDDVRHINTYPDRIVATVYHKRDGKTHVWTPECPMEYRQGRNDACQYEVELPTASV